MWRRLLTRLRSRASALPTPPEARTHPAEPPLLLPGSNGQPFPALTSIAQACSSPSRVPDVLLFGDSVMERVSKHDVDRRDLGAMLASELPTQTVLKVSHSAFNPAIYSALARAVAACPHRPRLTVLPVNMRSFSPQWDLHPAWQFGNEVASVEAWIDDPDLPVPAMSEVRESPGFLAQYDAQSVNYPLSSLGTIGEFRAKVREVPVDDAARDTRGREIFVFHYTHALVPGHRRLVSLRETVECLEEAGSRVLLYVTPVNHEAGVRLVSDEFKTILRRNVEVLRASLAATGARLIDWSEAMPASRFFHEDLATEHLNELGRAALAARIADAVRLELH